MRLIWLTVLLSLVAAPAFAGPLVAAGAAAVSGWVAAGGLTTMAVNLAVGAGLTIGSRLLRSGPPGQKAAKVDLPVPSSRPPYRFNYGERFVDVSPIWRTKDDKLYLCAILNSRPSVGPFTLTIDKRPATFKSGNIHDLSGPGVQVSIPAKLDGHAYFWIGRGDQTSPPDDILSGGFEHFVATDAWRGRTVLWARFVKGEERRAARRWPNGVPIVQVAGRWSRVWDPRDPAQNPNNPATWQWSANQALCVLDALRTNPIRQWGLQQLLLDSFIDAANIADQNVTRIYPAGTEKRYRVDGQLIFQDGELEALIEPLLAAGASRLTHIGGKLGIVPGAWSPPVYMVRSTIGPPAYERWKPGRDLPTTAELSFIDPGGDDQLTPLPAYEVPGARILDGGEEKLTTADLDMVASPGQAQRVQKITAMRARAQRSIVATLPPDAFNAVAGSNITVALPAPYTPANGVYELVSTDPGLFLREEGGVAMRIAVEAVETSQAVYAWDPATEEKEMAAETYDPNPPDIDEPGEITAMVGPEWAQDTGGTPINRIRFTAAQATTSSRIGYEWEFRVASGDWEAGGFIDRDAVLTGGNVRWFLTFVKEGTVYATRIRTVASGDQVSDWRTLTGVVAGSAT